MRPNVSTVWRWAQRGVCGVTLETVLIGGRRYTSRVALQSFVERSTAADVLAIAPPGKRIFVEIKCGPEIVPTPKKQLTASGLDDQQIVIIAFNAGVVQACRRSMPQYKCNWLTGYKRAIFFKYLAKLLKFGCEREGVDLSDVVLTHHKLSNRGKQDLGLSDKDAPKLDPMQEIGSGEVQEKQKAFLAEIIDQLNTLFGSDTTEWISFPTPIRS